MDFLEIIHHASSILGGVFLTWIAVILYKKNKDKIRASIFLKYNHFKTAFLIMAIGAVVFILGNILAMINHERFDFLHEIGEIIFNITILAFAILIFNIIKGKK